MLITLRIIEATSSGLLILQDRNLEGHWNHLGCRTPERLQRMLESGNFTLVNYHGPDHEINISTLIADILYEIEMDRENLESVLSTMSVHQYEIMRRLIETAHKTRTGD